MVGLCNCLHSEECAVVCAVLCEVAQSGSIHHFPGTGHKQSTFYCGRSVLDGRPCGPSHGLQCTECALFQVSHMEVDRWSSGQLVMLAPGYRPDVETVGEHLLPFKLP